MIIKIGYVFFTLVIEMLKDVIYRPTPNDTGMAFLSVECDLLVYTFSKLKASINHIEVENGQRFKHRAYLESVFVFIFIRFESIYKYIAIYTYIFCS